MLILNNLPHDININIDKETSTENRELYLANSDTIILKPLEQIELDDSNKTIYLFGYDIIKKIIKRDRFRYHKSDGNIMIGQRAHNNIIFYDNIEFNANTIIGLSYIIPQNVIFGYNLFVTLIFYFIIIVGAIIIISIIGIQSNN